MWDEEVWLFECGRRFTNFNAGQINWCWIATFQIVGLFLMWNSSFSTLLHRQCKARKSDLESIVKCQFLSAFGIGHRIVFFTGTEFFNSQVVITGNWALGTHHSGGIEMLSSVETVELRLVITAHCMLNHSIVRQSDMFNFWLSCLSILGQRTGHVEEKERMTGM